MTQTLAYVQGAKLKIIARTEENIEKVILTLSKRYTVATVSHLYPNTGEEGYHRFVVIAGGDFDE